MHQNGDVEKAARDGMCKSFNAHSRRVIHPVRKNRLHSPGTSQFARQVSYLRFVCICSEWGRGNLIWGSRVHPATADKRHRHFPPFAGRHTRFPGRKLSAVRPSVEISSAPGIPERADITRMQNLLQNSINNYEFFHRTRITPTTNTIAPIVSSVF